MNPTWLLVFYALACHGGVMLAAYNGLNSTGLPRRFVKTISKLMFMWTMFLPILVASQIIGHREVVDASSVWQTLPTGLRLYTILTSVLGTILVVRWTITRPGIEPSEVDGQRETSVIDLPRHFGRSLSRTKKCRWLAKIPGNQILQLSIEHLELPIPRLPAAMDGLRIAHLSDLHLTGHIEPDMSRLAVEKANQFQPELFVVTGDIIDHVDCIDWLPAIFADVEPPFGKHFILGNHDKRHGNTDATRAAMRALQFEDLGGRLRSIDIKGQACELIGNESPWYEEPSIEPESSAFRILLSHSPDRIAWARRHGIQLMLAGHTHGGQGRLPLVGPLIAPSRHGTRFASGDFYLAPTTMHVTRGISGTHLLRLRCRPEVSFITLRRID